MTQHIGNIVYTPTSTVNDACIYVQQCNSAIDSDWQIQTEGTDNTQRTDAIKAKYAIVDNLLNNSSAQISYGSQVYGVAPYTRRTFALPDQAPIVEIQLTSGIVVLTLCEANMQVPDEQNQLASSGGNTVGEYNPFFFCTGPTPVANQLLFIHRFEEPVQYQIDFNGFQGGVSKTNGVNPAANYVCNVYKNNVAIGTLTYHTDGTCAAATVGHTSGVFGVGDEMVVQGNVTPDGSIQNFSGTFTMTPT